MLALRPLATTYAIAAGIRLAFLAGIGIIPAGDTPGYQATADDFLADPLRSVGYGLLPPLMAIIRDDMVLAIALALIGAGLAPIAYGIADHLAGRAAGWVAALLAAFTPSLLRWNLYLLTDVLVLVPLGIAVERTIAALAGPSGRRTFASGASIGLAYLARAAVLLPGLVLATALWSDRGTRRHLAPFVIGIAVVLAPWSLRNAVAFGSPVPYDAQGTHLVWAGTQWTERGRGTIGVDIFYPEGYSSWTRGQRADFHVRDTIRRITEDPLYHVGLSLRKLWWTLLPVYPEWSVSHKVIGGGLLLSIYALAVVGTIGSWRRPGTRMLVALIAAYLITIVVTYIDYDGRYRLPVEFLLTPLAGAGFAVLRRSFLGANR